MSPRNPRGNPLLGDCLCFRSGSKEVIDFHNSESLRNDPSSETGFRNRKLRFHMRACCAEEKHNRIVSKEEKYVQTCEPRRIRSESARNPLRIRGCARVLGHPGSFLGHLGGALGHPGGALGHMGGVLGHLGGGFGTFGQPAKSYIFYVFMSERWFGTFGQAAEAFCG